MVRKPPSSVYDTWYDYNEANCLALRAKVKELYDNTTIPWVRFGDQCGFPEMERWVRQEKKYQNITASHYYRIVLAGLRDGWLGKDVRPLYEQFRIFLNNPPLKKQDRATEEHFEVYRYSFLARDYGYVLRGSLTINFNSDEITTEEDYKIQKEVAVELAISPEDCYYPRSGMLFPRNDKSYLMISKRNRDENEVQTALLERVTTGGALRGAFSDLHGRFFHATRIYAVKTTNAVDKQHLKAVNINEVPDAPRRYLTAELNSANKAIAIFSPPE